MEKFKPIHLTEEWLLRLGFKEELPDNEFTFGRRWKINSILEIVPTGNPYNIFVINSDSDESAKVKVRIQYVHQLQNLFYALTGNELTLTPAKEETL